MTHYAAFLRGINVGGRNIKMADLKKCFEEAGFKDVSTLLNSGNVKFDSELSIAKATKKIEEALTQTFSYPAKVIVKEIADLQEVINNYPFKRDEKNHAYVIFLSKDIAEEILSEAEVDDKLEEVKAGKFLIYWRTPKGMTLKTSFGDILTKSKFKELNTVRNLNTVEKLLK